MRTRAEIIARILACRKLADPATNPEAHEREAARMAAERLIKEYGITNGELSPAPRIEVVIRPVSDEELRNMVAVAVAAALRKRGIKAARGWPEPPPEPRKKP